jgi:hypothetical protein
MLLLFWLPILLREFIYTALRWLFTSLTPELVSLLWSFHNGIQFVYHTVKNALPLKTLVRS